jgi:uncharacterized protein with PhoU and TrkA domain
MDLEIAEIIVPGHSRFAGESLAASKIRHDLGVIVLAIKRGSDMRMNPTRDEVMRAGDYLIVMGEPKALRKLEQEAAAVVR